LDHLQNAILAFFATDTPALNYITVCSYTAVFHMQSKSDPHCTWLFFVKPVDFSVFIFITNLVSSVSQYNLSELLDWD